jgi:exopolysaccharide biosynthesis polyprenyl glycosylphosphotransferase
VLADVSALLVAAGIVTITPGSDWLRPAMLLLVPLAVVLAKLHGLYDRDELVVHKTTLDQAPALLHLSLAVTLVFWVGERFFVYGQLGHLQALSFLLVFWATLTALRFGVRELVAHILEPERVLFVGDLWTYERLREKLAHHCPRTTRLVGRLELHSVKPGAQPDNTTLSEVIRELGASRVVVSTSDVEPAARAELVRAVNALGVRVSVVPRVLDVIGSSAVLEDLGGMTLLGVPRIGMSRSSRLAKRLLDLVGASVGLVATAPLLVAIALAIKIDSRGPVLFRQDRIGRDGRRFRICKFRTMTADAESRKEALRDQNDLVGGMFKIAADPRVTRVGRLLRRTSLDELPQLLNVWRGQMSLVGPRPLVADEDASIRGYDRHRLALTPGMTGPWQILRGQRTPLAEMVKIDYVYAATWTLWTDVKILIRTVPHVLLGWGL